MRQCLESMVLAKVEMQLSSFRLKMKVGLGFWPKSAISGKRQQQQVVSSGTAVVAAFSLSVQFCSTVWFHVWKLSFKYDCLEGTQD